MVLGRPLKTCLGFGVGGRQSIVFTIERIVRGLFVCQANINRISILFAFNFLINIVRAHCKRVVEDIVYFG